MPFYVLGDFNLKNKYVNPLYEFTEALQIKQIIDKPTRKLNTLDLIFTNDLKFISSHKVFDAS